MKKIIGLFLIFILLISSTTSFALTIFNRDKQELKNILPNKTPVESPITKGWDKTFGGIENDMCFSVQQTTDHGYILAGWTSSYSAGKEDFWLIKTNSYGHEKWNRTFGGTDRDLGCSVQQTTDGGYIITGYTYSYGAGCSDVWLIKTNIFGVKTWGKTFGGADNDFGYFVTQTDDGGYIIAGRTWSYGAGSSDVWLIKTDENGNKMWDKTFGGVDFDSGISVQQTNDSGYIITGNTYSFGEGSEDVWLIKTDKNGDETWNRTFGGTLGDSACSIQQTSDNGYIISGYSYSFSAGKEDSWLVKTDINGNKLWDKTFGNIDHEVCYSVKQTNDSGYILAGYTNSFGEGSEDIWLIKTDTNGVQTWNKTFGGTESDKGYFIQQTKDAGYIILGSTWSYGAGNYDVWLIKTNSQGKQKTISSSFLYLEKLLKYFTFF